MKAPKALITSAAVAVTMVGASAAMALNGGILDTSGNDGVGTLDPTLSVTEHVPATVDLPDFVTVTPSDEPIITTSSASTVADSSSYESSDDHDDYESDDSYEYDDGDHDDDDHDDDSDDESHEYEGYDYDD